VARHLCATARRLWPAFVREHWPTERASFHSRVIELFCDSLETWTLKHSSFKRVQLSVTEHGADNDFRVGARLLAMRVCGEARQAWPRLIADGFFEPCSDADRALGQDCKANLLALLLAQLEGWLAEHVAVTDLPAIEFASFGEDSTAIAAAYEAYRVEFGG
jgi:hypothetical protein